jgi:hypothetical protein
MFKYTTDINLHTHGHRLKRRYKPTWQRNPFDTPSNRLFRESQAPPNRNLRNPRLQETNLAHLKPRVNIQEVNIVDQTLAHDSLNLQTLAPNTALHIFTDGSCTDLHSNNRSAGCGIFITTTALWEANQHRFTKAEDIQTCNSHRVLPSHKDQNTTDQRQSLGSKDTQPIKATTYQISLHLCTDQAAHNIQIPSLSQQT